MGIRFYCPNGHHLHVKSFLAGKRGICPHCRARLTIPLADSGPVQPSAGRQTTAAATSAAGREPAARWYVRPATGGQFGPASDDLIHQWIGEMRVTAESLVWREDWTEWRPAHDVFQELRMGSVPVAAVSDWTDVFPEGNGRAVAPPTHGRSDLLNSRRLVLLLSFAVVLLTAGLMFVVFYVGQG